MRFVCALVMVAVPTLAQEGYERPGTDTTFQDMWQGVTSQDYTMVELRRFFPPHVPSPVTVREEIRVVSNGTSRPDFEIDFLGVEGEPNGSPLWTRWSQNYTRHGSLFFEHGQFRIRDLQKVVQNYTLHGFGAMQRIGRAVHRVVVFPNQLDKSIWLLDVDDASGVPLYAAEFDVQLHLLSELEAVSFTAGAQLQNPAASSPLVTVWGDFVSAKSHMGNPAGLVEPVGSTDEYDFERAEVKVDPLNNRQTLELEFTDGIDQFFVLQTPGSPDFFAALPLRQPQSESHTIARYRDPAMSVLLFWDDGVSFQVAGRGSLRRLDGFAKTIYTQAILGQ